MKRGRKKLKSKKQPCQVTTVESTVKSNSTVPDTLICDVTEDSGCRFLVPMIDYQVRRASNIFNKKLVIIREEIYLGTRCSNEDKPCIELNYCPALMAASLKCYKIKGVKL